MLSGRYPSDEFAELRPRVTWDRVGGTVVAREGAKRVAIANGGTIPDRGLYGVFLVGAGPGAARVGELDEEMVFESRAGETFVLGASSWRIEEITHDRVLVSPAPGQPGKMPFWKGDRAGRPLELGLAIGRLMRDLLRLPTGRGDRPAHARARSRRRARPRTCCSTSAISCAAARAVPDAAHRRHRARSRRARRLARLRAVAARRPDAGIAAERPARPEQAGIERDRQAGDPFRRRGARRRTCICGSAPGARRVPSGKMMIWRPRASSRAGAGIHIGERLRAPAAVDRNHAGLPGVPAEERDPHQLALHDVGRIAHSGSSANVSHSD